MSFMLAAVSVLLEFTVAQLLTVFHGSTAFVYFLTIGIYSFFLGVGSFFFHWAKVNRKDSLSIFFYSEVSLAFVALLSPFLILLSGEIQNIFIKLLIGFLPLSLIAFFSGVELPFLLDLVKQKRDKDFILFWDFAGMFAAGLLFAFVFLDVLTVFQTLSVSVFFTTICVFTLLRWFSVKSLKLNLLLSLSLSLSLLLFLMDNQLIILFRSFHGY
jgi:predicted membrane-bound spermidine synthase